MPSNVIRCYAVIAIAAIVVGCSGSPVVRPGAPRGLADATNSICVTPQAQAQTVTLPSTGGVTGTISFGAFDAGATGCDVLRISTGAAVETTQALHRRAL